MSSCAENILQALADHGLDGLIVSCSSNISYLTAFLSRESYFLVSEKKCVYFTDSRYSEEAVAQLAPEILLKKVTTNTFELIAQTCLALNLKNVGFEERNLPFAEYNKLKKELSNKAKLVPTHNVIEGLREVKKKAELKKIQKAVDISVKAFKFIKDYIEPGKKELEIAAELEKFIRYQGASGPAFDLIVASGPNSSRPHHATNTRKIANREAVLLDIGVTCCGYKSDLTRVFFSGKITALGRKIYDIVRFAQERAINKVKPGLRISEIDKAARQYIIKKGYGAFFSHNLGHGIGLDTHEQPNISPNETARLKPGMVFTIEPGIYLPSKFGVRIEDVVLVTEKGYEVLSGALHK